MPGPGWQLVFNGLPAKASKRESVKLRYYRRTTLGGKSGAGAKNGNGHGLPPIRSPPRPSKQFMSSTISQDGGCDKLWRADANQECCTLKRLDGGCRLKNRGVNSCV